MFSSHCHLSLCYYLLPGLLHQLPYWSPSTCPLIYLLHNCLSEVFIFLQIFKSGHAHFSLEPSSGFQLHLESPVCSSPWPTRPLTTWLCFLHIIWFQPLWCPAPPTCQAHSCFGKSLVLIARSSSSCSPGGCPLMFYDSASVSFPECELPFLTTVPKARSPFLFCNSVPYIFSACIITFITT